MANIIKSLAADNALEKFIKFLEANNALENFEREFTKSVRDVRDVEDYKKECRVWKNSELNRAFPWDYTKEGYEYWSSLNDLWRGECESLK